MLCAVGYRLNIGAVMRGMIGIWDCHRNDEYTNILFCFFLNLIKEEALCENIGDRGNS